MNKEQQELLDEVYGRYWNSIETSEYDGFGPTSIKFPTLMKEQFVERIKTDDKFSEKWGLKIDERELSLEERMDFINKTHLRSYSGWQNWSVEEMEDRMNNDWNIPTKLITVTYNNKTIESYE